MQHECRRKTERRQYKDYSYMSLKSYDLLMGNIVIPYPLYYAIPRLSIPLGFCSFLYDLQVYGRVLGLSLFTYGVAVMSRRICEFIRYKSGN